MKAVSLFFLYFVTACVGIAYYTFNHNIVIWS